VLNEHNTVFARSGLLYATAVFLGPPASSTQTTSGSFQPFLHGSLGDRPHYSIGSNRSAQWRSHSLLLSMATTSIYWSSRLTQMHLSQMSVTDMIYMTTCPSLFSNDTRNRPRGTGPLRTVLIYLKPKKVLHSFIRRELKKFCRTVAWILL